MIVHPRFEWIVQKNDNSFALKLELLGLLTQEMQAHIRTTHAFVVFSEGEVYHRFVRISANILP